MRANTAEKWLQERVEKYGPVSKLSLFGKPTIFIHGQAANKLIFASDQGHIANNQTKSIQMILGDRNLLELDGEDHKRVKSALMRFLRPESLNQYVGKMEDEIRLHLQTYWQSKEQVNVLPLMKILTFNIVCSLLFGIERGGVRDELVDGFQQMIEGMWAVLVNFPFTRYNRSLKASEKVQKLVKKLIHEKREQLKDNASSPNKDLITCLLSIRNKEDNEGAITDKEIVHNVMLTMVAGHDTSAILVTFMMMFLANEPSIYEAVLQEQEEIACSKSSSGESLVWEDLAKMKHTWRVAMETLRMVSPIFGGFRKALKDIEFGGFLIPKGWQIFWASSMTQMDNNIYREATKFDPYRFENKAPPQPYCFVAFGGGPRMCPGHEFARIETLVTIHYLITRFSWKLRAKSSFYRDPTPTPDQGLPVQIIQKKPL